MDAHPDDKDTAEAAGPAVRRVPLRETLRRLSLLAVNIYIVAHVVLWYGFDIQPWGKTAMTGVPALVSGNINIAAVMVILIVASVFIFGRGFCGWACHMRGVLEFSDWLMRRFNFRPYLRVREKNVLLNTRYRWLIRVGAFAVLLMPVSAYLYRHGFVMGLRVDMTSPPPWADLPGYKGLLFNEAAPINWVIAASALDIGIVVALTLAIIAVATFVFNIFYGQGAFCRILCPYSVLLAMFSNINPFQRKITRVNQCTGCRKCSSVCPQGIDVSREIYHYGKVENRDCIKCFTCVDTCENSVLKDTAAGAVAQVVARTEYEKRPWIDQYKTVQKIEPMDPVSDFVSMILALAMGGMASRFGGFWFFVGVIAGFLIVRLLIRYVTDALGKYRNAPATTPSR